MKILICTLALLFFSIPAGAEPPAINFEGYTEFPDEAWEETCGSVHLKWRTYLSVQAKMQVLTYMHNGETVARIMTGGPYISGAGGVVAYLNHEWQTAQFSDNNKEKSDDARRYLTLVFLQAGGSGAWNDYIVCNEKFAVYINPHLQPLEEQKSMLK